MFTYEGTLKQRERIEKGLDHCTSGGKVYNLADLISGEKVRDPTRQGRRLSVGRSVGKRRRVLIYAVDENFRLHVGFDCERTISDAVKHETLFQNADVRAAGELEIADGVIVEVDDISGTYGTPGRIQTDPFFADAVLRALDGCGAPIKESERERLERRAGRR